MRHRDKKQPNSRPVATIKNIVCGHPRKYDWADALYGSVVLAERCFSTYCDRSPEGMRQCGVNIARHLRSNRSNPFLSLSEFPAVFKKDPHVLSGYLTEFCRKKRPYSKTLLASLQPGLAEYGLEVRQSLDGRTIFFPENLSEEDKTRLVEGEEAIQLPGAAWSPAFYGSGKCSPPVSPSTCAGRVNFISDSLLDKARGCLLVLAGPVEVACSRLMDVSDSTTYDTPFSP